MHPLPLPRRLALLPALVALACGMAQADTFPSRKAGLWEVNIQSQGQQPVRVRHCIDAKTDAQMQQMGQGLAQDACSKNELRRDGAGWAGESVCKMGTSTITSRSTITGDPNREIRMVVDATYAPPMMGMSKSQTTITQRHAGDCPAGWRAGDMEVPGSPQRMNVTDMLGATGKGAPKR